MNKSAFLGIGLLAGFLLGAAGMRAYDRRTEESPQEAGGPAAGAAPSESYRQMEAVLAAANRDRELLAARVAELERAKGAEEKTAGTSAKANPWTEIGARLFSLRDRIKESNVGDVEEAEALMMEFLGYLGKIANQHGVSLEEALLSPDGTPSLVLAVLAASGNPPDAAQAAAMEKILEEGRAAWKDYLAKRGDLSKFEQRRELLMLDGKTGGALRASLTPEQEALASDLQLFDNNMSFGHISHTGGSRESVVTNLTAAWATELKLDDVQRTSLRPLVEEYMRDKDALEQDWARRGAAGQPVSDRQRSQEGVEAMIRVQKRISETMRLTEEQEKAIRGWGTSYEYTIRE